MGTVTVNISFQDQQLGDIDRMAKAEHRSRSELLREAVRQYIEHQRRWDHIFKIADNIKAEHPLSESDVIREIEKYRAKGGN